MTTLWTIGHGDRTQTELVADLRQEGVTILVDVRSGRGGVRQPQFSEDALGVDLHQYGMHYFAIPALGGRRPKSKIIEPDVNAGWENQSFHNYADHTQTADYREGIRALEALAEGPDNVAIMCSEIVPWRCHRQLVASTLVARGHEVLHIVGHGTVEHHLGQWGAEPELQGLNVVYPGVAS